MGVKINSFKYKNVKDSNTDMSSHGIIYIGICVLHFNFTYNWRKHAALLHDCDLRLVDFVNLRVEYRQIQHFIHPFVSHLQ
jgi:hypothetical protein